MKSIVAMFTVLAIVTACTEPPKTYESMLAWRLKNPDCQRRCPTGRWLQPVEPQATHILEDCCDDEGGVSWASCAWNVSGRFMTSSQLTSPARFATFGNCGTPGWPDCDQVGVAASVTVRAALAR